MHGDGVNESGHASKDRSSLRRTVELPSFRRRRVQGLEQTLSAFVSEGEPWAHSSEKAAAAPAPYQLHIVVQRTQDRKGTADQSRRGGPAVRRSRGPAVTRALLLRRRARLGTGVPPEVEASARQNGHNVFVHP